MGACRSAEPTPEKGLAGPPRGGRHTAARGMRPVVPVLPTSSGSHTLRTRGEVPELIGDAPITVRSEPLTECNLPAGKMRQTCGWPLDDHQQSLVRGSFDAADRPAPALFAPSEFVRLNRMQAICELALGITGRVCRPVCAVPCSAGFIGAGKATKLKEKAFIR